MLAIMLFQVVLICLGVAALFRMVKQKTQPLDTITAAVGLVAATQLNISFARIRHGASINYYDNVPDWTISNFIGAGCLLFLLVVLIKTRRRI